MNSRICAIHQPNLFPRWRTLAKLLAADTWVVLDDVQFCRRDYQHRARLGRADRDDRQWLVLPVHLPRGRGTRIRDVLLADPDLSRRRVAGLTRQYYRRAPAWPSVSGIVDQIAQLAGDRPDLAGVAETSTTLLLRLCGWSGVVVRSSDLARTWSIGTERSERLADLTSAAGCDSYLCGSGGRRYLRTAAFDRVGVAVRFFDPPGPLQRPLDELTSLAALAGNFIDRCQISRSRPGHPGRAASATHP